MNQKTMEDYLQIIMARGFGGIALWQHHSKLYLGCLLDGKRIRPYQSTDTTFWYPVRTCEEVVQTLTHMACLLNPFESVNEKKG